MPTIVKRAVWKHGNRPPETFLLARHGKSDYRWISEVGGKEWDGVYYLEEGMAIRAMRHHVDSDPSCVGVDLTIYDVEPPAEERAAKAVRATMGRNWDGDPQQLEFSGIIARETNIGPITAAFSELIAFLMTRRVAIHAAITRGQGRDLAFDGLLHAAITELGKSTKQDFSNLLKPLTEGVSNIVQARAVPKPPEGTIQ